MAMGTRDGMEWDGRVHSISFLPKPGPSPSAVLASGHSSAFRDFFFKAGITCVGELFLELVYPAVRNAREVFRGILNLISNESTRARAAKYINFNRYVYLS